MHKNLIPIHLLHSHTFGLCHLPTQTISLLWIPKPKTEKPAKMAVLHIPPSSKISVSYLTKPLRTHKISTCSLKNPASQISSVSSKLPLNTITAKNHLNSITSSSYQDERNDRETTIPTMSEIMDSSKSQNLSIQIQTIGPFFRITVTHLETKAELGKAEGFIRVWLEGKILHLDSIRLQRETLGMEKSIFGIGLFIGAVAIRFGYDSGCKTAELLAINDSDHYHSKLVRFYTRFGFKAIHEVNGSSMQDFAHMLMWGGQGTRMNADIEELLVKWGRRFKARSSSP